MNLDGVILFFVLQIFLSYFYRYSTTKSGIVSALMTSIFIAASIIMRVLL